MEKIIALPEKENPTIDPNSIKTLLNSIILVYENGTIIGSVIYENNSEEYLLSTLYVNDWYTSIEDILKENKDYIFKYITKD